MDLIKPSCTFFLIVLLFLLAGCKDETISCGSELDLSNNNHLIISYGQSLSKGTKSLPVITTHQRYSNLMLKSGLHLRSTDPESDFSDFVPLVETELGVLGETPVSGAANYISQILSSSSCVTGLDTFSIVGIAPGEGAMTINELSKGTDAWLELFTQIESVKILSEEMGRKLVVAGVLWSQGESDYRDDTEVSEYQKSLVKLHSDFRETLREMGVEGNSPLFLYQVASHRRYGKNDFKIAISQKLTADLYEDIEIVAPLYSIPHHEDGLHLTASSSEKLGRYFAKSILAKVYDISDATNGSQNSLDATLIEWSASSIVLEIHNVYSHLVIDEKYVQPTSNFGFDIWSSGELLDIIDKVEIFDGTKIRVSLRESAPQGAVLSYGKGRVDDPLTSGPYLGPRGNIRDRHGDVFNYLTDMNKVERLDNYLVMFEINNL